MSLCAFPERWHRLRSHKASMLLWEAVRQSGCVPVRRRGQNKGGWTVASVGSIQGLRSHTPHRLCLASRAGLL